MFNDEKQEIFEYIEENNAITLSDITEIYSYKSSGHRALKRLQKAGLLKKKKAPIIDDSRYVWVLSEKSRIFVE